MTEKEKMQKQMLYDANNDRDLLGERAKAKDLCYQFNQLRPSDEEGQQELMRQLLGKTKGEFCVVAPFWCDYGYNIEIGENFFANHNTVILDGAKVKFGDNVFIALDGKDRIVGGVGIAEFVGIEDYAELQKLYLDDSVKGKGYGKELMGIAEDWARSAGYKELYLETHTNLSVALKLYEKMSFHRIEKPCSTQHSTMNRFYLKEL